MKNPNKALNYLHKNRISCRLLNIYINLINQSGFFSGQT